jgi:hypothetical protein
MSARPSALPLPKPKTHFDLAGALAEGFLGGAFAGAAGDRFDPARRRFDHAIHGFGCARP